MKGRGVGGPGSGSFRPVPTSSRPLLLPFARASAEKVDISAHAGAGTAGGRDFTADVLHSGLGTR